MTADPRRVQSVFLAAVEQSGGGGRAAVLDRECGNDRELRRRVDALLRMHDLPGNALDTPIFAEDEPSADFGFGATRQADDTPWHGDGLATRPDPALGTVIAGRYRLTEVLGEGGMGRVYRAEQLAPVRRAVAVKLVRPGLGTESVFARFATERQALALMDHPNIARVLDAGTADSGQPFFVMELVNGEPVTEFCDARGLSLRDRLELFLPICLAIQHAHQKGVIHRDLKPGNVLVAMKDGRPVPFVIDFGVAKSLGERLTDGDLQTGAGLFIGSLEYMSPEQAARGSADVDTRADVYALGALLYELLSGSVPFDRDRLRGAPVLDVARMIQTEEPPPPSVHDPALRGDLDWVVMKCLDKDRERRYPAAAALADDVGRYLRDEPVEAGPPTRAYRLRKFIRRHRAAVAAALLFACASVAGAAGITWGLVHAKRSEAVALAERDEKERQRSRADTEAASAKAVLLFLQNDVLRQADTHWQVATHSEAEPNLTVRSALDRSAASVERRFRGQPAAEAAVRRTIGCAYEGLGEYGKAIAHLSRAVVLFDELNDDDNAMNARVFLGVACGKANKNAESVAHLERAWEWRREKLGAEHADTWTAENLLGVAYGRAGRMDDAERLLTAVVERAATSGPGLRRGLAALNNLAYLDVERGRLDDAVRRVEDINRRWIAAYGPDAPERLEVVANLGQMYLRAGRLAEAVVQLEAAYELATDSLPPEHPRLAVASSSLAEGYWEAGRAADAGKVLDRSWARIRDKAGPNHPRTQVAAAEWALWAAENGQTERGEHVAREAVENLTRLGPTLAPTRALAQAVHASCLLRAGRPAEAEPLAREAMDTFVARRPDDWAAAAARALVGQTLVAQNRCSEAEPFLSEAHAALKRIGYRMPYSVRRRVPEIEQALAKCTAVP